MRAKNILGFIFSGLLLLTLTLSAGCGSDNAPGAIYGSTLLLGANEHGDVLITIETTSLLTISKSSGAFVILNVPQGTYNVTASKDGYISQTQKGIVVTKAQAVMNVNFVLISSTPPALPK